MPDGGKTDIPRYFLYGDRLQDVELDFLHVEPIRERSGANDWTIRAHAHPDHVQFLLVDREGGAIRIEDRRFLIEAPALVVVPAAMVHEIQFRPGTDGTVVTAALAYLRHVARGDGRLGDGLAQPDVHALTGTGPIADALAAAFAGILREYVWSAPGRRPAILSHMLQVFVALMRLRTERSGARVEDGNRDHAILDRYRATLETHFRNAKRLDFYAAAVGVSPQRLNQACKARSGKTSSELLHERIIVEAKRYLIYMDMSVAEIGYELGFEDPAYFSRFFARRVGVPPVVYRERQRSGVPAG